MDVLTSAKMRQVDEETIARFCPGLELMERAGRKVAEYILDRFPAKGFKAVLFVGPGNNGGDALVVARYLSQRGRACSLHYLEPPTSFKMDAAKNYQRLRKSVDKDRHLKEFESTRPDWEIVVAKDLRDATLVVDSLFGTGLARGLDGRAAEMVALINGCDAPVLAVDTPSGIHGDTGEVLGAAVRATWTITMGFPKLGMLFYPGKAYVGELVVADLGFPDEVLQVHSLGLYLLDRDEAAKRLPVRKPDAHKYGNGTVVLVAGSRAYTGAAMLAAEAALRGGCGMLYAVVPEGIRPIVQSGVWEAIVVPVAETTEGSLATGALPVIRTYLDKADALVVGPGLGQNQETMSAVVELVTGTDKPLVLDADGINAFAGSPETLEGLTTTPVLTPHSGELRRLLASDVPDEPLARIEATREAAKRLNVTLVHKGAPTLIASAAGEVWVNQHGNSALATGGTGDVLTGLIGGLIAQGASSIDAAAVAAALHGCAGELAADVLGVRGVIASDLMGYIGVAANELETNGGTTG